jgi:Phytanoyl-CoA dioxygenase (PhyH)
MNSRAAIQFEKAGFAVFQDILDADEVREISLQLVLLRTANAGTRRLLNEPWCLGQAQRLVGDIRLSNLMPQDACAVQCTYFTKSSTHNWLVTLHQDLSIPVADRIDSEHCTGWSQKEGGLFVQPPSSFLEDMLAVRVHLDDTNDETGALRIVHGSHALGRLTAAGIAFCLWTFEITLRLARWPPSDGISWSSIRLVCARFLEPPHRACTRSNKQRGSTQMLDVTGSRFI